MIGDGEVGEVVADRPEPVGEARVELGVEAEGVAVLGLFRPGSPGELSFSTVVPASACDNDGTCGASYNFV